MGVNRKRGEVRGKDGGMEGGRKEGDFQKFEILTASMLCSANLHHRAKCRTGRSSRSGNFNCPYLWRIKMRHHAIFCADRSNSCGDIAVFDFQDSGRSPSCILKSI